MTDHTPTPWRLGYSASGITGPSTPIISGPCCGGREWPYEIITKGQETLCIVPAQSAFGSGRRDGSEKANAAFIVRAVNCHDDLVAALDKTRELVGQCAVDGFIDADHLTELYTNNAAISAVIAKVRGEKP